MISISHNSPHDIMLFFRPKMVQTVPHRAQAAYLPWPRPRPAGSSHRHQSGAARPSGKPARAGGEIAQELGVATILLGDFKCVIDQNCRFLIWGYTRKKMMNHIQLQIALRLQGPQFSRVRGNYIWSHHQLFTTWKFCDPWFTPG